MSELVGDLAETEAPTLSLGELVDAFGASALASLLLVFGLACALPLPPGATTVFGAPLVVLAPQLMFDKPSPWLPRRLRERRFATADLKRAFARMIPWLKRMEAVSRPRLSYLLAPPGRRVIGFICTVFALVLILPIPLGNILPAITVTVFALSLIQRDGAVAVVGYLFALASLGALVLAANLIAAVFRTAMTALSIT